MESEAGSPFRVVLPGYEGTLDGLTSAIAEHRLEPESLTLSALTRQLAEYVGRQSELDLDALGETLAVSARLLALKSARLSALPPGEDDGEAARPGGHRELVISLRLREAARSLADLEGRESFAPLTAPALVERVVEPRRPEPLPRLVAAVLRRGGESAVRLSVPSFIRLEAAVSSLIRRLRSGSAFALSPLLRGANRQDAVVHFLAVLELVRRKQAQALQSDPFGEIVLQSNEHGSEASSRAG